MKKVFLLLFILLACVDCGYAQNASVFAKPWLMHDKKLTLADSLHRRAGIVYLNAPAVKGSYKVSVDQSSVRFLYGSLYNSVRDNYVQVLVRLTNASADTLRYLSMSCSWWDIYRTDNEKLKIFAPDVCYKNGPIICMIPPHQYIEKSIVVVIPKESNTSMMFKVGMVLQKESDNVHSINTKPSQFIFSVPARQKLIWSNYVMISRWNERKKEEKYNFDSHR